MTDEERTCGTCVFWYQWPAAVSSNGSIGECNCAQLRIGEGDDMPEHRQMIARSEDSSSLLILTNRNFGCVHYRKLKSEAELNELKLSGQWKDK